MAVIPRLVKYDVSKHEPFALATHILSIPRVPTKALVVFPGCGEDERVIHAVDRFCDEKLRYEYLLVAGVANTEKTWHSLDVNALCKEPFGLPLDLRDRVMTQMLAEHTPDQAKWTADMVRKHDIESLTITAPPRHLTRAYLTLLPVLLSKVPWKVWLIPDPTPVSPWSDIPEEVAKGSSETRQYQFVAGEMDRILTYQGQGDVADSKMLLEYLRLLYDEFITPK